MKILALDLGTKTGWALGVDGKLVDCGTKVLATAKDIKTAGLTRMNRRLDPRVTNLWDFLLTFDGLDWIVWEDVLFSSTTMQTQLWSSFRTTLWLFAHRYVKQTECLPVQRLKQFATGHGGATKEMMAEALVRQDPQFSFSGDVVRYSRTGISLTDDSVDAIHLLKWAQKTLCRA